MGCILGQEEAPARKPGPFTERDRPGNQILRLLPRGAMEALAPAIYPKAEP